MDVTVALHKPKWESKERELNQNKVTGESSLTWCVLVTLGNSFRGFPSARPSHFTVNYRDKVKLTAGCKKGS